MIIHTPLYRKENMIDVCQCNVIRAIELPRDEFFEFSNNLSEDYSFIADHTSEIGTDESGIHKCMLILCEGSKDGILVNSRRDMITRDTQLIFRTRGLCGSLISISLSDYSATG